MIIWHADQTGVGKQEKIQGFPQTMAAEEHPAGADVNDEVNLKRS